MITELLYVVICTAILQGHMLRAGVYWKQLRVVQNWQEQSKGNRRSYGGRVSDMAKPR